MNTVRVNLHPGLSCYVSNPLETTISIGYIISKYTTRVTILSSMAHDIIRTCNARRAETAQARLVVLLNNGRRVAYGQRIT
jgi:hypothetical protein